MKKFCVVPNKSNVKHLKSNDKRNLIFIQEKKFKKFLISILKKRVAMIEFQVSLFCECFSPSSTNVCTASMSYISLNFPVNNEIKFKFIFIVKILCLFYFIHRSASASLFMLIFPRFRLFC